MRLVLNNMTIAYCPSPSIAPRSHFGLAGNEIGNAIEGLTAVLGYGYGPHFRPQLENIGPSISHRFLPPTTLVPVWTLKEPPSTAIPGLFKAKLCTE